MTPAAMELQVTLILGCLLSSTALALKCNLCIPGPSGRCDNVVTDCPGRCGTLTVFRSEGGELWNITSKLCVSDMQCISGSLKVKDLLLAVNMKCCNTDLCNNHTTPVVLNQTVNGQKCYTCVGQNCSVECHHCNKSLEIVDCVGNEDHCIEITGSTSGFSVSMAGCASESVCDSSEIKKSMLLGTHMKCCEGNLCNAAETFTLTFIFTLIPLLSSLPFY